MHPKLSLSVESKLIRGQFGKVHPLVCESFALPSNVFVAQLDVTDALAEARDIAKYTPISKLQPVDRDLAVVVERGAPVGTMLAAVKSVSEFIYGVKLFDVYEGEQIPQGHKSVAFSMRLQPVDNTFADAEIKRIMDAVLQKLETEFGAKLR